MPHVLRVDDQSFTPALSDYIQQQGLTVSTAHNFEEARARKASCVKTCTTGSWCSRSPCRRCATAMAMWRCSRIISWRHQNDEAGGNGKRLTSSALDVLNQHAWPGNMRELKNAIRRAHTVAEEDIDASHFSHLQAPPAHGYDTLNPEAAPAIGPSLEEAERNLVLATLERLDGDKRLAAQVLGVSLKTLYNKLRRYRIH